MLRFYLERSYSDDILSNVRIQEVFAAFGEETRLRSLLNELSPSALEHVLERLLEFQDEYPTESAASTLVALLSQLPRLSDETSGMFSSSPQTQLSRVIYRLFKRVKDESQRESIGKDVYTRLETLQARRKLVSMLGYQEHVGHGFISRAVAKDLEDRLTQDIVNANAEELAGEQDLVWICTWVERNGTPQQMEELRRTLRESTVMLALLRTGLAASRSQTSGDVAVKREWRLPWKTLQGLVGAEALQAAVQGLAKTAADISDDRSREAVQIAARYAGGWRPHDRFGREEE